VHTMASDDTEITLGVGKLLGLFFLLAAICGVFFSIGYSMGKSSGREQALNDQPAPTISTAASDSSDKPLAAVVSKKDTPPAPAAQSSSTESARQPDLTFYKSVQQNDTSTVAGNGTATAATAETPAAKVVAAASAPAPNVSKKDAAANVIAHTNPVTGPGTIVVQIAAVTREDDAVALAGALRKKDYNVFVVNNPITNDKFYHVQVGPFATVAEAEAMKAKLVAEGYNPIIKK